MIREKDGWYYCFDKLLKRVVPCKGAGVEIVDSPKSDSGQKVAPLTGCGN